MSVTLHKVWADLWGHKLRTLQVVLIIALGVFSVGLVVGGRNLSAAVIAADWQASDPPAMKISVSPPLRPADLDALGHLAGITAVEGFQSTAVEWRPDPAAPWRPATLNARQQYTDQQLSRWELDAGAWPTRHAVAIERSYGPLHGLALGDTLELRIPGDAGSRVRPVTIAGEINSRDTAPMFAPDLVLYMDPARFGEITGIDGYTTVGAHLAASTPAGDFDPAAAAAIDAAVQDRLDKLGYASQGLIPVIPDLKRVASPEVHFAAGLMNSSFLLLGLIGGMVILLGSLLIYTNVSAVITQQIGQIGIMKAIGARRRQIFALYATLIAAYGLLACLVAVPLSALAAHGLKLFFVRQLDIAGAGFTVSPEAVLLQVLVALLSPLAASLVPLTRGAGITVREAISTFGLGSASGLLDQLLARLKHVSYTVLLVIGSTFRHKARVLVTQAALVTGGMLFIAVLGVADAAAYTFGPALAAIHRYDVTLTLQDDARPARVLDLLTPQPEVARVELWNSSGASVRPQGQPASAGTDPTATVFGIPPATHLYAPQLVAGRWLAPGDGPAAAIHQDLAAQLGVGVGDRLTLRFPDGKEADWEVVGLFFDSASDRGIYVPQAVYASVLKRGSKANALYIQLQPGHDPTQVAQKLTQLLESRNFAVAPASLLSPNTVAAIVDRRLSSIAVLIGLLAAMALLVALVGGIGLSGTLSLGVLERTREIGVMRAIGATSRRLTLMFVGEGLIQALLSWCLAVPLGLAAAHFLATVLLSAAFGDALLYHFTPTGLLLWLAIVLTLGLLASYLPAHRATRLSVRESLIYQ